MQSTLSAGEHPQVVDELVKSTHRTLRPSAQPSRVGLDIQESYCEQAAE